MSAYRFSDASTSAEVSSLSLWKRTPFRSVMVTFLPSLIGSYFSSRSIFGPFFESRVNSPSKTCQPKLAVTVAVVKTGSWAGGSPIMAHLSVPPFFGSPAGGGGGLGVGGRLRVGLRRGGRLAAAAARPRPGRWWRPGRPAWRLGRLGGGLLGRAGCRQRRDGADGHQGGQALEQRATGRHSAHDEAWHRRSHDQTPWRTSSKVEPSRAGIKQPTRERRMAPSISSESRSRGQETCLFQPAFPRLLGDMDLSPQESQAFHMNGSGGLIVPWSFVERARSAKYSPYLCSGTSW